MDQKVGISVRGCKMRPNNAAVALNIFSIEFCKVFDFCVLLLRDEYT
jgi:hypothetical protein